MNAEDARRLATLLVKKMTDLIPSEYKTIDEPPPKSLKDIIHLGLTVAHVFRQFALSPMDGAFPIEPELIAAVGSAQINPAPLTDLFARGLEASDEDPLELEAAVLTTAIPRSKLTNQAAAQLEQFKAAAKRQNREDRQLMFEMWEALEPPLVALLELQRKHPKTEMAEALRFLAPEFPGLMRQVELSWPTLEVFIAHSSVYAKAKQINTKARLLAAAIVARRFEMSDAYCLQLLTASRRTIKGRLRRHDR
jgi:hypothetical protein